MADINLNESSESMRAAGQERRGSAKQDPVVQDEGAPFGINANLRRIKRESEKIANQVRTLYDEAMEHPVITFFAVVAALRILKGMF